MDAVLPPVPDRVLGLVAGREAAVLPAPPVLGRGVEPDGRAAAVFPRLCWAARRHYWAAMQPPDVMCRPMAKNHRRNAQPPPPPPRAGTSTAATAASTSTTTSKEVKLYGKGKHSARQDNC